MHNNELYHHGVKGMKWGVRRAKRQLAKRTGRKLSSISDKEAQQFRTDVKKGVRTGKVAWDKDYATTFYSNSDNTRIGKKYYKAVVKQQEMNANVAVAASTAAGLAFVMGLQKKGLV